MIQSSAQYATVKLATQTLRQKPAKTMLVQIENELPQGTTAKDLILYVIGIVGTAGGTGHVIEYAGSAIENLDMAGRMTVCNMSIEAGARAGLIAPDETTFEWLAGRPGVPAGAEFDLANRRWAEWRSDSAAKFDKVVTIDASEIAPMVTWGTSPEAVVPITGTTPHFDDIPAEKRDQARTMMTYMALEPGHKVAGLPVDVVFIGSCTNGRIEDLRDAARVAKGRRVADGVRALVVPGSGRVKRQAEDEGLADVFRTAGFEWREAGCSMCLGMNPDRLRPGERCASTSNRNFEGRQGPGGRTHLMSPAMAAAAAVTGSIVDVRDFL